jgi:hypothetical protein
VTFNALIAATPDTQLSGCSSLQCADVPSKSCGSSGGFGGSNLTQLWAVYELMAEGGDPCFLCIWLVQSPVRLPLTPRRPFELKPQQTPMNTDTLGGDEYVGCYEDRPDRVLTRGISGIAPGSLTIAMCRSWAAYMGFPWYGLQSSRECWGDFGVSGPLKSKPGECTFTW